MSLVKKLASETAVYGLSSIVGRLLNYLLVPLYTSVLTVGEYGVSSVFYAYASFAAVVFSYGMETAFFRYYQKYDDKEKVFSTALTSLIISSLAIGIFLFLLAKPIMVLAKYEGRETLFRYLIVILAADAVVNLIFAWLRQKGQAKKFASLKLLSILTNILLNILAYYILKLKDVSYMFLINVVSSLIVVPFFSNEIKLLRFGFDKNIWKEMLHYAFPLIFMGLAGMVNETIDRILLKGLLPTHLADQQVGIYAANYKLSILITLFIQAFRFAAEPFFFSRMKDQDAKKTYATVMNYFVIVCSTIFLVVLLYLDIFKHFLRNKAYWEGLNVVPILLMANVFLGIYYNLSIWFKLSHKTKMGAAVAIIGAVITLILNYLWIPSMGYTGSAWATLICYFAMCVMSYTLGQKYYPVPYNVKKIALYIGASLVIYALSDFLAESLKDRTALKMSINTLLLLLYVGAIFLYEKKALTKMVNEMEQNL